MEFLNFLGHCFVFTSNLRDFKFFEEEKMHKKLIKHFTLQKTQQTKTLTKAKCYSLSFTILGD